MLGLTNSCTETIRIICSLSMIHVSTTVHQNTSNAFLHDIYDWFPAVKLLNEEITSDIQKHKQNIWKEHLDAHWDHMHNTHTLWKTIHGLSNRAPPHTLNTSITFNNKIATTPAHIANCFTKQFTSTQHTKQTH